MRIVALIVAAGAACAQSSSPDRLFRDAVAAQQHGDDALAVRKYQELLKRYPDAVEVRANLGAALAKLGRYDEAIEEYRAVLAKKDNPDLRFNLALAYYKKGALREALQQLDTLRRAQPGDTRVATLEADCYARLGQDEQVIAVLTPVEAAHPDDLAVAWLLGSALIRAGHKRDGLERVDRVARQGNRPEAYLLAGRTALKMNEFERARDDADAALRLNPRLPGATTLRGTVLSYLGDTQLSLIHISRRRRRSWAGRICCGCTMCLKCAPWRMWRTRFCGRRRSHRWQRLSSIALYPRSSGPQPFPRDAHREVQHHRPNRQPRTVGK